MLIDQLPTIPTVEDTDELAIEKGTTTYKVTKANLLASAISAISTAINAIKGTATPLEDGTAAVGTSGLLAREDHVHPHDSLIVRKNLLDNWYFVGGGSQQGYGVFPINQRGQASYSSAGYTIDRWTMRNGSITLDSDGLKINAGSVNRGLVQSINFKPLLGKTVTCSVLVTDFYGPGRAGSMFLTSGASLTAIGTVHGNVDIPGTGLFSFTCTIPANLSDSYLALNLWEVSSATDLTYKVAAIKLEVGDTQTLAHQENGNWVLNEVPEYGEELQKCQRYFLKAAYATDQVFCSGFLTNGGQDYTMLVPCPTEMVRNPTVTMTSWFARGATGCSAYATYSAPKAPVSLTCYKSPVIRNQLVIIDSIGTTSPDANNTSWVFSIINLTISCEP